MEGKRESKVMATADYRSTIQRALPDDWIIFIATFGRFEFAMKRAGFLQDRRVGRPAQASWVEFFTALGCEFLEAARQEQAINVFFTKGPNHLILYSTEPVDLRWQDPVIVNEIGDLAKFVRRVRNSLFHGEKSIHQDRDENLVKAALALLDLAFDQASNPRGGTADKNREKLSDFVQHFRFD